MKKLFFSLILGTIIAICWVTIIHTLKWIAIKGNEYELIQQQNLHPLHRSLDNLAASETSAALAASDSILKFQSVVQPSGGNYDRLTRHREAVRSSEPRLTRLDWGVGKAEVSDVRRRRSLDDDSSTADEEDDSSGQMGGKQLIVGMSIEQPDPKRMQGSWKRPNGGGGQQVPTKLKIAQDSDEARRTPPTTLTPPILDSPQDDSLRSEPPELPAERNSLAAELANGWPSPNSVARVPESALTGGPNQRAGLVYRAPFFTSWFVSTWNILFMPVFTLISSCCFRNEDSSTKKLLV